MNRRIRMAVKKSKTKKDEEEVYLITPKGSILVSLLSSGAVDETKAETLAETILVGLTVAAIAQGKGDTGIPAMLLEYGMSKFCTIVPNTQ
jgi:hypothetical protein